MPVVISCSRLDRWSLCRTSGLEVLRCDSPCSLYVFPVSADCLSLILEHILAYIVANMALPSICETEPTLQTDISMLRKTLPFLFRLEKGHLAWQNCHLGPEMDVSFTRVFYFIDSDCSLSATVFLGHPFLPGHAMPCNPHVITLPLFTLTHPEVGQAWRTRELERRG